MAILAMRHDFRARPDGAVGLRDIYAAALEQFDWADQHGFTSLVLSEHHGIADGWMPAPLTIAAAVLARTKQARVMVSASILPLHDPIRIAEQIAVIDNAFPGRLWVVFGAGYRVEEFEMAGLEHAARGRILEEHVETVLEALSGDDFEWRGRNVRVTPKPITDPRRMLFIGGGVPAAARRAARLKLPMFPMNDDQVVRDAYFDEAKKVGFTTGFVLEPTGPTFVHVTDDPDKTWSEIGDYLLYEAQTYSSFQTPGQHSTPKVDAQSIDDLKASPQYVVGTPDDVVKRLRTVPDTGGIVFNPLAGGLPPAVAWPSLELFAQKVLPQLTQ
ncbi:MAG TPA: LLM class flavin-dependent oxidoreductase [Acidimicrobiia bacterium]|nr:LLM class flavin-dependent oxidoreductase [Acidimicrobiia bacterium]